MDVTNELTIVIPVRVDCMERKENLDIVLSSLLKTTNASVIILEADSRQHYTCAELLKKVKYVFIKDNDPIFHRTRYLNKLLEMSKTRVVGIWDTDVIIRANQIKSAVRAVNNGATLCYPYDGCFMFLDEKQSNQAREDGVSFLDGVDENEPFPCLGRPSVGGAFIVDKREYRHVGGENENFYGWGYEDAERLKRLEILEKATCRIKGPLYHLYHPRGINSGFDHGLKDLQCLKELVKVCKMDKRQLMVYINSPYWNVSPEEKNSVQTSSSRFQPLVSIVMPVYNCEEYVESAVCSILRQTHENLEFIIINDGSTDSTAERINRFKDERVVVINHLDNKGNYHRRNEGIGLSKGKYIGVMDADDVASPFRVEAQVSLLEQNRSVIAAGSQSEFTNRGISMKPMEYELIKVMLLENNMFIHPTLMIRKSVLEKMGNYNECYYYSSDYDLVCRLALEGMIVNMPDVLLRYRIHDAQITHLKRKEQKEYADVVRANYLKLSGFSLTTDEESVFTRIMNRETNQDSDHEKQAVIDKIINQNKIHGFFDQKIITDFLYLFLPLSPL